MNQIVTPWEGWNVVRNIGKGTFGKVYEIQRNIFGFQEYAAMKVLTIPQDDAHIENLRAEGMDEESITQTLHGYVGDIVREYRLMLGLKNCPNIVHCDDLKVLKLQDRLGWVVYIKMELLKPLMKSLDQVSTEEQIIKLAKDLCYALVTCQNHNILHRDIKPQNIFLADDGNFKLGDFGISRNMDHTTYATVGVGTFNYMAPEVLSGDSYGSQADIYSLGMVLYWLLNRKRQPFLPLPPENYTTSMAEEARRRRFRGEELPAPADGSNELHRIVLKACSYKPQYRFASAQEMLDALNDLSSAPNAEIDSDEEPLDSDPVSAARELFHKGLTYIRNLLKKAYHNFESYLEEDEDEEENAEGNERENEEEDDERMVYDYKTLKSIFFTKEFLIGVVITVLIAVLLVYFILYFIYSVILI